MLLLSFFITLYGCGGGGNTGNGSIPVVVVTAMPSSNTINTGYLDEDDYTVDWNATATSDTGAAVFEGLIPGERYIINTSMGSTLSNVVVQAGVLSAYPVYSNSAWTPYSFSGYTEFSGKVLEVNRITPVTNGTVKIISESSDTVLTTSISSQGKFSFTQRVPIGYYTIITAARNYITNVTYHYPFRTDMLTYTDNLVRNDQWNYYAGSFHPYDPNKGYLIVSARNTVAEMHPLSGVSMTILPDTPYTSPVNTPVIIYPTATPSIIIQPAPTSPDIKYGNISGRIYTNKGTEFPEAFVVFKSFVVSDSIASSGAFTRTTTAKMDGTYRFTDVPQGAGIVSFWAYQYNYENYPNNPLGSAFVTVKDNTDGVILQQQNNSTGITPTPVIPTPTPSTSINVTTE